MNFIQGRSLRRGTRSKCNPSVTSCSSRSKGKHEVDKGEYICSQAMQSVTGSDNHTTYTNVGGPSKSSSLVMKKSGTSLVDATILKI